MRKHINRSEARYRVRQLVVMLFYALRDAGWGWKLDAVEDICDFYWLKTLPYIPVRFTYAKFFRLIAWVLVGR